MESNDELNKSKNDGNEDAAVKPDPETLHKTDPQDNMKGPISSLMQGTKDVFESDQTKEEADKEKDLDK